VVISFKSLVKILVNYGQIFTNVTLIWWIICNIINLWQSIDWLNVVIRCIHGVCFEWLHAWHKKCGFICFFNLWDCWKNKLERTIMMSHELVHKIKGNGPCLSCPFFLYSQWMIFHVFRFCNNIILTLYPMNY